MKNIILIVLVMFTYTLDGNAQEKQKKIVKTSFWVNGECEMCQDRIQKAALKVKGVKMAKWSIERDMLTVIYKTRKCTEADIKKSIAAVGHDSEGFRATDAAYDNLHGCCKYDRDNIPDDIK